MLPVSGAEQLNGYNNVEEHFDRFYELQKLRKNNDSFQTQKKHHSYKSQHKRQYLDDSPGISRVRKVGGYRNVTSPSNLHEGGSELENIKPEL
jgi:hypothetical protein